VLKDFFDTLTIGEIDEFQQTSLATMLKDHADVLQVIKDKEALDDTLISTLNEFYKKQIAAR